MDTPKDARPTASDFPQELIDLYDYYAHGLIDRRTFLDRAAKFTVGGLTAAALLQALSPNYALAVQVPPDDPRIEAAYTTYESPRGHGTMRGLLTHPARLTRRIPGVLVVHENRGLNPYIEDVARRLAVAGYLAFAPDALTPLGGYPGNDDEGRAMQRKLDREKLAEDFMAAARFLHTHPLCDGNVGVIGFCFGGAVANALAVALPDIIKAAVPFYGRQPDPADVPKIKAALLLHYAEHDERVNAGWPAYEAALKANNIRYTAHIYPGVNHGFHNDTTPRYDEAAARLAWQRTLEFLRRELGPGAPAG
ncbi:MAG: dienelactone hydrolase family protein [Verrucomicrobia bacterium]|nr:MAG: dienelactone hydrolase family protein [Verrucomicrobiota bacterium]